MYTKTKEAFGWPERPLTPGIALSNLGGAKASEDEGGEKEVIQASETHQLFPIDKSVRVMGRSRDPFHRLVCYTFSVLGSCYISNPLNMGMSNIVSKVTPLLNLTTPHNLQYHTRFLLSSIVRNPPSYNVCKVGVVNWWAWFDVFCLGSLAAVSN